MITWFNNYIYREYFVIFDNRRLNAFSTYYLKIKVSIFHTKICLGKNLRFFKQHSGWIDLKEYIPKRNETLNTATNNPLRLLQCMIIARLILSCLIANINNGLILRKKNKINNNKNDAAKRWYKHRYWNSLIIARNRDENLQYKRQNGRSEPS